MTYFEAKSFYECMESVLNYSKEQKKLEDTYIDLKEMEYVNQNNNYSVSLEGIREKIENTMRNIGDFFHKLVLRFGVFIREFMQNVRRKKSTRMINDLSNKKSINVPYKVCDWLWKVYTDLGIKGWDKDYPTEDESKSGKASSSKSPEDKFKNSEECVVPVSDISKYLQELFVFSKSIDKSIMDYVNGKTSDITPAFLNENKITYEEYPGFLRNKANKATKAIKMIISILNKAASSNNTEKYIKKAQQEKDKKTSERNQKFAQKQADKIKKKFGKDSDVTVVVTKKKKEE